MVGVEMEYSAPYAPTPSARNIYPAWLTVEYATISLDIVLNSAIVAANRALLRRSLQPHSSPQQRG